MAERGIQLHSALANVTTRRDFKLFLISITSRSVNHPKGYVVGLVEPYHAPVCVSHQRPSPLLEEGADTVVATVESPGTQHDEVQGPRPDSG